MMQFSRLNHYIPQFYLKSWCNINGKIWNYRLLVSNERVPIWSQGYLRSTAVQNDLYIRLDNRKETDDFEYWLCQEVECPAEKSLSKAISGQELLQKDWDNLIRLLAVQFARTPARFVKQLNYYNEVMPPTIEKSLKTSITELENAVANNTLPSHHNVEDENYGKFIPMKVSISDQENGPNALLCFSVILGRGLWLSEVYSMATRLIKVLQKHRWHIIEAAPGVNWCVSDDPVICLNYYGQNSYDFKGGMGNKGGDIIFPLSPRHVMFTHIGEITDISKFQRDPWFTYMVQRFTIEHAFRYIYACTPWYQIVECRQRIISKSEFDRENEMWKRWNKDQNSAELSM